MSWKRYADWAKARPMALRLADALGRGRGRLRLFDHCSPPPRAKHRPDLSDWEKHDLAATWIGHATILLRIGGTTVLTDPVMGNRVGLGLGLITGGPRRHFLPALSIRELPKIDLILISHAHFDHLDRPTLSQLNKKTRVITAHHTQDLIRDLGFRDVTELRWGDSTRHESLTITAREVRHWGARTFHDTHRGFNAYLIESARHRVLYGGDTAYHDHFRDIARVHLAILGIGAYNPWHYSHATPEQAWQMANHVRADYLLPMHHSTFRLSYEPRHEPLERLLTVAGSNHERIVIRDIGMSWAISN